MGMVIKMKHEKFCNGKVLYVDYSSDFTCDKIEINILYQCQFPDF